MTDKDNRTTREQAESRALIEMSCAPYGASAMTLALSDLYNIKARSGGYNPVYEPHISCMGKPVSSLVDEGISSVVENIPPRNSFARLVSTFSDVVLGRSDYLDAAEASIKSQREQLYTHVKDGAVDLFYNSDVAPRWLAKTALKGDLGTAYLHDMEVTVQTADGFQTVKCPSVSIIAPINVMGAALGMVAEWAKGPDYQLSRKDALDFSQAVAAQAGIDGAESTASVAWFDRLSGVFVSLDPEMTKNMREALGFNTPRPNYWPKCMRLDIPS